MRLACGLSDTKRAQGMLPSQRLPRDRRCHAAIELLLAHGADRTPHSGGRCLLDHLVGTAQHLLAWNAPIDTLRAGLCHSIYGTHAFRQVTLPASERAALQRRIGRRAEAIVWLFANLQRPDTLLTALERGTRSVTYRNGRLGTIRPQTLAQLTLLEMANLLDQGVSIARLHRLARLAPGLPCGAAVTRHIRRERRARLRARCALPRGDA